MRKFGGRKRVLVTGGAGFLGSHLVNRLIARGDEVLCADNMFTGDKRNGTTTLFAALNVLDGTVIGRNMQRHRHQEFIRFLAEHNESSKPFVWTADPDKIIAAVRRGHQVLDSIH